MGPNKAKILLVDDEPLQLKVLRTMVDTLPYSLEVISCENGQEAIDYLEGPGSTHLPDIIITDYLMPVVDGLELLSYVRKRNKFKSVSVLMVSAFDEPEIQKKALDLGVDDFLRRPLNQYEMQARCNSFIHFSHHVRGTLEHAMFYDQRFNLSNCRADERQNDALEALIGFTSAISGYPACYHHLLTGISLIITRQLKLNDLLCLHTSKAVALHAVGHIIMTMSTDSTSGNSYNAGYELLHKYDNPVFNLPQKFASIRTSILTVVVSPINWSALTSLSRPELQLFRFLLPKLPARRINPLVKVRYMKNYTNWQGNALIQNL